MRCLLLTFLITGLGVGNLYSEPAKPAPSKAYTCFFTPKPLTIDGKLDEPEWQHSDVITFHIPGSLKNPVSITEARILWDDQFLYVGFRAYDKEIRSQLTRRDANTCQEDVLEIFIKPSDKIITYYNFEINALGTVYDAMNFKRNQNEAEHRKASIWNCDGLKIAVFVKGKINNRDGEDEFWQLEVAIPFSKLPSLAGKAPKIGEQWKFHLARYDHSVYLSKGQELSSSANLSIVSFHYIEEWNTLKFARARETND